MPEAQWTAHAGGGVLSACMEGSTMTAAESRGEVRGDVSGQQKLLI